MKRKLNATLRRTSELPRSKKLIAEPDKYATQMKSNLLTEHQVLSIRLKQLQNDVDSLRQKLHSPVEIEINRFYS